MDIGKELRVIEVDDGDIHPLEIEWPEPETTASLSVDAETKEA